MAQKRKKKRVIRNKFKTSTYRVYGEDPVGNHYLDLIMFNDESTTKFVSKNKKALARLPKNDAIKLIKSHIGSNWAREDAKKIKNNNVRAADLKRRLLNFND